MSDQWGRGILFIRWGFVKFFFFKEEERGLWRRSLEMACQQRTGFRCKRNKGIYYQKFRCNQEGGGRSGNDTRVASTARCNQES